MTTKRQIERTLLIDADDTLWENNIFYLRCSERFQGLMEQFGYDRDSALEMLNACEQETIPTMGYGPDGYVAALGMACERLLGQTGQDVPAELVTQACALGGPVLSPPMVLIAGVEDALVALRPTSQLVLVTKGHQEAQHDKIERSGLAPLFDAFYIVAEKDAATYRRIASELHLNPREVWMVGNSPKSDINPAIEAGLGAILVPHNHTWTAEIQALTRPDLVVTLRRLADLVPFFGIETIV
jgi:putative hydrolase of the HAD superfamily